MNDTVNYNEMSVDCVKGDGQL